MTPLKGIRKRSYLRQIYDQIVAYFTYSTTSNQGIINIYWDFSSNSATCKHKAFFLGRGVGLKSGLLQEELKILRIPNFSLSGFQKSRKTFFNRQLDFNLNLDGVANEILANEPKSCFTNADFYCF